MNERRHWLDDDYVKFIRLAEHLIGKNKIGVAAFVTNHGYLSNPTFRGMRWSLLRSFDKIYVLDLHGNSNRKEVSPDGKSDKNVFDIRTGVAIIIAIKSKISKTSSELAELYHSELWGTRDVKYENLWNATIYTDYQKIENPHKRYYMFYPIDDKLIDIYDAGFDLSKLMNYNQKGIITARDGLSIGFSHADLEEKLENFLDPSKSDDAIRKEYFGGKSEKKYPAGDTRSWKLPEARARLAGSNVRKLFSPIYYRPFDSRIIALTEYLVDWPRTDFMQNFFKPNIGIAFNRQIEEDRPYTDVFIFD